MNQPAHLDIADPQDLAVPGGSTDPAVVARHARHLSALALLYLRHAAAPRAMVLGLAAMAMGDLRPQTILLVAESLLQAGDPEQALTVLGRLEPDAGDGLSEPVNGYHVAARDYLTARVLMRRGDEAGAREALDRAIAHAATLPPLFGDADGDHDDGEGGQA